MLLILVRRKYTLTKIFSFSSCLILDCSFSEKKSIFVIFLKSNSPNYVDTINSGSLNDIQSLINYSIWKFLLSDEWFIKIMPTWLQALDFYLSFL